MKQISCVLFLLSSMRLSVKQNSKKEAKRARRVRYNCINCTLYKKADIESLFPFLPLNENGSKITSCVLKNVQKETKSTLNLDTDLSKILFLLAVKAYQCQGCRLHQCRDLHPLHQAHHHRHHQCRESREFHHYHHQSHLKKNHDSVQKNRLANLET